MQQLTSEELMEAYQLRDVQAFDLLYNRYQGRIYGYLRQKLRTSLVSMVDDTF